MRKDTFSPPAIGGSTLLVIFALLAMCVFAVLSLSTAQSAAKLSEVSAQAVEDFYAADLQAEKQFIKLKNTETKPGEYSFSCQISENRHLLVRVRFNGADWEVLQWQSVSAEDPQIQETLSLWDGKSTWE